MTKLESSQEVSTILLDDLLEVISFKKAVMKIDVEGHEHKAFDKAHKLLNAINISYIYMEWLFLGKYQDSESEDFTLLQKLLLLFQQKEFEPYMIPVKQSGPKLSIVKLTQKSWTNWPQNILWAKSKPILSRH